MRFFAERALGRAASADLAVHTVGYLVLVEVDALIVRHGQVVDVDALALGLGDVLRFCVRDTLLNLV